MASKNGSLKTEMNELPVLTRASVLRDRGDLPVTWRRGSLLALAGGEPAGFVIGNIDVATDPPGGEVWQVGVVPAHRRRGLASALMVEAMRRMKAAGVLEIHLEVNVNNPGAIQAYEKLGFEVIGRRAKYERAVER